MRSVSVVVAALAVQLATGVAHANGRFPATVSVALREGAPDEFVVGATFGMLISRDDGQHVSWVCEQALGYNTVFDPHFAFARDGTIYATTFDGLEVSRDGGCTFELAPLPVPTASHAFAAVPIWVSGIALGPDDEVWVTTSDSSHVNDVYESVDGGHTFHSAGLASNQISWGGLAAAPSAAGRVYVAGYQLAAQDPDAGVSKPTADVRRTDDAGAHWQMLSTSNLMTTVVPIVVIDAVSPVNADLVFAHSAGDTPTSTRLYRSINGAQSWMPVLDTSGAIESVVVRTNGDVVVTSDDGLFRSIDGGATFAPITGGPLLTRAAERADGTLFACGANYATVGFALGRSADLATWTSVFHFADIAGPLACPPGTVQHDICDLQLWPMLVKQLGVTTPDAALAMPPLMPDAAPVAHSGGCCETSGGGGAGAIVTAALALGVRRRRRRSISR